jgi:hypothetical protein
MPDDRPMPKPPDGETTLSDDVYEHTVVEAFRNSPAAFAVMIDPERSCIWIGARGRALEPDTNPLDALLWTVYKLVDHVLSIPADPDRPGHYRKGDA